MKNWNQIPKKNIDWYTQDDTFIRHLNEHMSYPSTQSPKLNVGDFWYIKYLGSRSLVEVEIKEVSSKTVVLIQSDNKRYTFSGTRYEISDIKFVEKVEKV